MVAVDDLSFKVRIYESSFFIPRSPVQRASMHCFSRFTEGLINVTTKRCGDKPNENSQFRNDLIVVSEGL